LGQRRLRGAGPLSSLTFHNSQAVQYFEILKKDPESKARTGIIHTAHGDVETPAFLPIGTKGSVKSVTSEELKFWGANMILANT